MKKIQTIIYGCFVLVGILSNAAGAGDTGEITLETMTVTAQKQEENIQDVPMAITAFSAQGIEDAKIESVSDLADFVPNFIIFQ